MKQLKRSNGLILAMLVALTVLLAACGSSTTTSTPTTPSAASVAGEFVGIVNSVDYIGISSNGQQIIVYACDGTPTHPITFATWFKGPVTNNTVNLTATNGNSAHLVATLTAQSTTGTITLTTGQSFSFTANPVSGATGAGLYRDEQTFGGVRYLAGWIVSTQPSATSAPAPLALLSGWAIPPPRWGGGIINEHTGALINGATNPVYSVPLSTVTVPNVGTFTAHLCRQAQC